MADLAAEPHEVAVVVLEEHAAALRARQARAATLLGLGVAGLKLHGVGRVDPVRRMHLMKRLGRGRVKQFDEQGTEPAGGDDPVDVEACDGARRHGGIERLFRVLHDRRAAQRLDHAQPGGAVVEHPGQDDADAGRTVFARDAAKQRVDGGTEAVLPRAARQLHPPILHEHVDVGRAHVDATVLDEVAVGGRRHRQGRGAGEDLRERAEAGRGDVQDHEDRRLQVTGQAVHHARERFDAPRGGAHRDRAAAILCHAVQSTPTPRPVPGYRSAKLSPLSDALSETGVALTAMRDGKMHQTTVRFGPDLWAEIEVEASLAGVPIAQFVRDAALTRVAYTRGRRGDTHFDRSLAAAVAGDLDGQASLALLGAERARERAVENIAAAEALGSQRAQASRQAERLVARRKDLR